MEFLSIFSRAFPLNPRFHLAGVLNLSFLETFLANLDFILPQSAFESATSRRCPFDFPKVKQVARDRSRHVFALSPTKIVDRVLERAGEL